MNSSRPFQLKLVDIRPTQLYINAAKIANIRKIYNPISLEVIPPVPVAKLKNGTVFFVDGHTRAFVAWKHGGLNEINVVWESGEFDLEAYEICLQWCEEAGITKIGDLNARIVPNTQYKHLWLHRCAKMQRELETKRKKLYA